MKIALLDVNLLIALLDPDHEFHESAHAWFSRERQHGWATTPITENACLRILSNPGYAFTGLTVAEIRDSLALLCSSGDHHFWPDSVSLLDESRFQLSDAGPKNLTDLYLLGTAVAKKGRLVTFDRNIRARAVVGVESDSVHLLV